MPETRRGCPYPPRWFRSAIQEHPFVFFDLDGVLVDSRRGIIDCVNATLLELGYASLPDADIEAIIGPPLRSGFATLLRQQGHDDSAAVVCVLRYRALYGAAAVSGTVLQPGIGQVLEMLREEATLSVATSKPLAFAEPILRALGIRNAFGVVAGPTLETDGETKSQTLKRAIALASARSSRRIEKATAFMIGDRSDDMIAARANDIAAVGVTWGFGSSAELIEAGAETILAMPAELPRLVRRACAGA